MLVLASVSLAGALMAGGCGEFDSSANPQAAAPPPLQFIGQWGAKGDGPGQLDEPVSIATDAVGNVYIADGGSDFLQKFAPSGKPLFAFQDGALKHPEWIALDRGGGMYAADPVRNCVYIYKPNGDRYRVLHLRTRPSAENEISVAVGDDGLIHVFDPNADTVFTYTLRMRMVGKWEPGKSAPNASRRLGPMTMGPDGQIFIADAAEGKILRFSAQGHYDTAYAWSGAAGENQLSREFAVSNNAVYAMDMDGVTVHVWSLDGTPKLDVDLSAELGHESHVPPRLAVSPRGELLVLDAPADRVLRYHINF
jgi:hypothetical protein